MKKIFVLLFLMLSLHGIAQTPATALEYNDQLTVYTDSLFKIGTRWGQTFNDAYISGNYSPLSVQNNMMDDFISRSIKKLELMKDTFNSKDLRLSMIGFLKFEKTLVERAFRPFEAFNKTTPADTVQAAINNLKTISQEENDYLKKVGEQQEIFATGNHFTIEAKKE